MSELKEFILPSGAMLKIQLGSFAESKALYQAFLEEVRHVQMASSSEVMNVFKDLACVGFSSKKIEAALEQCLKRCLYNDAKIDKNTFEPSENRQDYIPCCVEVARENITPFTKSLFAEYERFLAILPKSPA